MNQEKCSLQASKVWSPVSNSTCAAWIHLPIRLLINGLKKEKPQGNDQRLPLTLSLLLELISRLREECFGSYTDLMLESALLTALYGFLRGGEFTTRTDTFNPSQDLTISDVTIYSHYFTVYLKHSKTNKNKEDTVILFCPLSSMLAYLRSHPQAGPQDPLFSTEEGKPMSRAWFASRLRLLCQYCGLSPERYTAHSLRIGAATNAASSSPVSTLKAMGRWSSVAYERYLRPDA